jgi:hypothetical protein
MGKTLKDYEEEFFTEGNGGEFAKIKDKLIKKFSIIERARLIEILMEYSKTGKILHWRNFLLTDIIRLVNEDETMYADFFQWTITKPELTYWGIDGLIKTQKKDSYDKIISLAQDESLPIETRAKAIKSIALKSKQPFDRDLPTDPGYWKIEAVNSRIKELLDWKNHGYNQGISYKEPQTHPNLKNPKTELEKVVAQLDCLLEKQRKSNQDLSNPSSWLVIADEQKIIEIEKKWTLPQNYLQFLKNFSPINTFIDKEKFFQGLSLYGADDLINRQEGYSFNAVTAEIISDWPSNYIVIADAGADPYCIDIGNIKNNDAPIYTSFHGAGEWEFEKYTDSFIEFLTDIVE